VFGPDAAAAAPTVATFELVLPSLIVWGTSIAIG
jgi:hypothetical protein